MGINIFKRLYTVRKYKPQVIEQGYASADEYMDVEMMLNVQPMSPNELMVLPEGERTLKRVKAIGSDEITAADDATGIPGDRLLYAGSWYECKSSVHWDHTMLRHYRSEFVILPYSEQEKMIDEPEPEISEEAKIL